MKKKKLNLKIINRKMKRFEMDRLFHFTDAEINPQRLIFFLSYFAINQEWSIIYRVSAGRKGWTN